MQTPQYGLYAQLSHVRLSFIDRLTRFLVFSEDSISLYVWVWTLPRLNISKFLPSSQLYMSPLWLYASCPITIPHGLLRSRKEGSWFVSIFFSIILVYLSLIFTPFLFSSIMWSSDFFQKSVNSEAS